MAESASPKARQRRSDRKAATQHRILEAAIALFSARGFERTSVSAIATRAGVSHSAVFWHFGDKATLFEEAFRAMLVPFIEELKQPPAHRDPRRRFFELFDVYEQFVSDQSDRIETIVRWMMESRALRESLRKPLFKLHDHFTAEVQSCLEELLEDPDRARSLAAGLIALLDGRLLLSLLDSNQETRTQSRKGVRELAELALSGAASK